MVLRGHLGECVSLLRRPPTWGLLDQLISGQKDDPDVGGCYHRKWGQGGEGGHSKEGGFYLWCLLAPLPLRLHGSSYPTRAIRFPDLARFIDVWDTGGFLLPIWGTERGRFSLRERFWWFPTGTEGGFRPEPFLCMSTSASSIILQTTSTIHSDHKNNEC